MEGLVKEYANFLNDDKKPVNNLCLNEPPVR